MKKCPVLLFLLLPFWTLAQQEVRTIKTEVLVIGGGAGGIAAAIQSARLGVTTVLVEPTTMLGGMLTAAGVSCTDGNDQLPSGIWEEFRQALYKHYNRKRLNTGWVSNTNFEPHVADSIFKAWTAREKNLTVIYQQFFKSVLKQGNKVVGAVFYTQRVSSSLRIQANVVVDGTELGDVFAGAGAAYDLGMDDPLISGEKEARVKNDIIQDLSWAAILKDYGPGADKTIPRPEGYDSTLYFCCCTDAPCTDNPWNGDKFKMLNYGKLPRSPGAKYDKYMLNWPPHGNDIYLNVVEESYELRVTSYEKAKLHTLGFIYFMQTTLGMKNIGLADDELDGGLALIPYNREGRRVKGVVRMNIKHIKDPYATDLYRTGISVGDYPVDHHHARYPGKVPEIEFPPIPSFNVPLGALIPEKIDGLIVCEKGISVTNIVNGTTRLQPVVMLTGQGAGVLAALSIKGKKKVREVPVRMVQEELLKAKAYLMPFVDVKTDDPHWEAIQRVGVTGILKGTGKAEGWGNKLFFYPDSLARGMDFAPGISRYARRYFNNMGIIRTADTVTVSAVFKLISRIRPFFKAPEFRSIHKVEDLAPLWKNWGMGEFSPQRILTRKELCIYLNNCLLLWGSKNVWMDLQGALHFQTSQF